ncbi:MAG: SpoIID/LytB domain-containing protein [Armatimonadetes bacterium]|nr:SpoIID/LytB domain-containing protein [Armatimonadota bacterium]
MRKVLLAWLLLLAAGCAVASLGEVSPGDRAQRQSRTVETAKSGPARNSPVAVLRSPPTLKALGWRAEWELSGAVAALERLGVRAAVLTPEELPHWEGRLLILPNVRNMAPETVEAVRAHVARGAKVLATSMSSYRKHDNSSWTPNNFALAELFGADFHRWVGAPPEAAALILEGDRSVTLGRNQAMLIRPRPEARVIARWDRPEGEAAIVEGPGGIYAGEDLFAPENSESAEVLTLIGDLIQRLSPGLLGSRKTVAPVLPEPLLPEVPPSEQQISVGLGTVAHELRLRSRAGVGWSKKSAPEVRLREIRTPDKPPTLAVYSASGQLLERSAGPLEFSSAPYLEVLRQNLNGTYTWSGYRGSVEAAPTGDGLSLIHRLSLEAYLAGVVPSEVPAYFPPEGLKAMAVVARTYALSHLGRHQGYDVCAEVHCQVYRGLSKEAESTTRAVSSTTGEALTCAGAWCDASFHAACGGVGEDADRAWSGGKDVPYLKGRPDTIDPLAPSDPIAFINQPPGAYCAAAGRFRWEETYGWSDLAKTLDRGLSGTLRTEYTGLGELQAVEVTERTPLGRVAVLTVRGSRGEYQVRGDRVRWLFSGGQVGGAGGLNSTLFYLERQGERLRVAGGGWGHGVGMCQEGAAGRARAGQSYREILEHYYPGAELSRPETRN